MIYKATSLKHHLSFNTINSSFIVGTMRFQGSINSVNVQILLDSDNSNNFPQLEIARYLKLPIQPISCFYVLVGNGNPLMIEGLVKDRTVVKTVSLLAISERYLVVGHFSSICLWLQLFNIEILCGRRTFHSSWGENVLPFQAQFHHIRLQNTHHITQLFSIQIQYINVPQNEWLDLPQISS